MEQTTFIIGGREFTCARANAFAANKLLMRLQKIAVPVLGALLSGGRDIGDIDVKEAATMIAEHLDETAIDNIVIPLFAESKVYSVENKKFIKGEMDVNVCFTSEQLFDFYELTFEVARFQFSPFFAQMVNRFGGLTGSKIVKANSQENSTPT